MKTCPRCNAAAVQFAKPHCKSPTCEWFKCVYCKATYQRTGEHAFKVEGHTAWHSSQKV